MRCPDAAELRSLSDDAWMTYYRCPRCACVWAVDRDGLIPPQRVTWRRMLAMAAHDDS